MSTGFLKLVNLKTGAVHYYANTDDNIHFFHLYCSPKEWSLEVVSRRE